MSAGNRFAILVLGMHRSGTSALAGLLSYLGVDTGQSLSPSDEHVNPKGFWEHQDIVAIHEDLLEQLGSSWDDERRLPNEWWRQVPQYKQALLDIIRKDFSQSSLWAIKDPRLCRLLPLWREILSELTIQPLIVMTVRHPLEVAASLKRRDNFLEEKSHLLWLRYLVDMEEGSRGLNRYLTTYEQLLSNWKEVALEINQSFYLNLSIDDSKEALIDDFLEPSLRHHREMQDGSKDELALLSCSIYRSVLSMPIDSLAQSLNAAEARISSHAMTIGPWAAKVRSLEKEITQLAHQNVLLTTEISRVKSTFSWQVTRPLRLLPNFPGCLRKVRNRFR